MMGRAGRPQFDTSGTVIVRHACCHVPTTDPKQVMCDRSKVMMVSPIICRELFLMQTCSSIVTCFTLRPAWRAVYTRTLPSVSASGFAEPEADFLTDINSEIGLNTIVSLKSAQEWLRRRVTTKQVEEV